MSKQVLVVDDSNFFLSLMTDILSSLDYNVTTSFDGVSACKELETKPYDLIFTDLNMPLMDGVEFVRQVRLLSNGSKVPVVMVSSETDEERIRAARRAGANQFVPKPVDKNRIVRALDQLYAGQKKSGPSESVLRNARFFRQGDREIFVLNFATESQKEILQLIEASAKQIRQRPPKSVCALTLVQKGMYSNEILQKLKELARGNAPYIRKSAVVGVQGVYKVALDAISVFSKRKFKTCNSKDEALRYLLS